MQVRWDCPAEYVEYHASLQAPRPPAPPPTSTGLVSGYDTESENEEEEELDEEKKPDFIGPRIPEVSRILYQLVTPLATAQTAADFHLVKALNMLIIIMAN